MSVLWLSVRLARAGGWSRAVLVVVACAVAAVLVLLVCAVPAAVAVPDTVVRQRLLGVVLLAVLLPVASLVTAAARLSSTVRERRLAALRVLGVPASTTRAVAAAETGLFAAAGVLVGALVAVGLAPALEAADAGRPRSLVGPLEPPWWGWVAGTAGVLVVSLVVAAAPSARTTSSPLQVVRQASTRRPSVWRLAPLATGVALMCVGPLSKLALPGGTVADSQEGRVLLVTFVTGVALVGVGLPVAVPLGVRLLADVLVRRSRATSTLIAARRLQQEPAASTRVVSALLVGLFVVTGGQGVLRAYELAPSVVRTERALTTGPQAATLETASAAAADALAADLDDLRATPGVRGVAPEQRLDLSCPDALPCGIALVATCEQLPALQVDLAGCAGDRATWLLPRWATDLDSVDELVSSAPTVVVSGPDGGTVVGSLALPAVDRVEVLPENPDDPLWGLDQVTLLLPPQTPGLAPLLPPVRWWSVVLDGGTDAFDRLSAALPDGVRLYSDNPDAAYTELQASRRAFWAGAALVLGIGLLALLVTGLDQSVTRRRHLASLTTVGAPVTVLRTSQLLQTGLPLLVGLPAVAACGLLAGTSYLAFSDRAATAPATAVATLAVGAAGAALVTSAMTVVGLGRAPRPSDLRRE